MIFDINIEPLNKNDIEELVVLINSAYRGESSKKGWTTEADLLGGIRTDQQSVLDLVNTPGAIILTVKEEDNGIAGCVYLQKQGERLYLGMLTVKPTIQSRGLGQQLLRAAEKHATDVNCSSIIMTVIDVRHELIEWYKRKGYYPTGETRPFPTDPSFGIPKQSLQFIVLEKKL